MSHHLAPDAPRPTATTRREFLQRGGLALTALAISCNDREAVAAPVVPPPAPPPESPRPPPIPVTPPRDLPIDEVVVAPAAFRAANGELLAYLGHKTTYFWPAGGTRPGLRVLITADPSSYSGGFGIQLDRPRGAGGPLEVMFSIDGDRQWEMGLDGFDDASGQGAPDFVLAYDNAYPPGDRLRMAPGGYLRHGPGVGTPNLEHRLHIQGGPVAHIYNDRAKNILYLQSGTRQAAGTADWLIRGEGRNPFNDAWGSRVFGVTVDGAVEATGLSLASRDSNSHWTIAVKKLFAWIPEGLALGPGGGLAFFLSRNGRGYADNGWFTFSPKPPRPAAAMTAREWCDWAYEDAVKEVKPYAGVPSPDHPEVLEEAARSGADPTDVAVAHELRYGKDVSRIAIGTARWAHLVQDALERATTFEEFRAMIMAWPEGSSP